MRLTLSEPLENIFHLRFDDEREMCEAFLRFQEHYESPEFKGKIFTLDEYKAWYIQNSPNKKESGVFTYYDDWAGFNIPSEILQPFYEGRFSPLSDKETTLLNLFERRRNQLFYIVATGKNDREGNEDSSLDHENAHGLFYTRPEYRDEALLAISLIDVQTRKMMDDLLASYGGYHASVFDDEVHAYLVSDADFFREEGNIEHSTIAAASQKLQQNFALFSKKFATHRGSI